MFILVINAGSSSLKYELFRATKAAAQKKAADITSLHEGVIDRIGVASKNKSGRVKNHAQALQKALAEIQEKKLVLSLSDIKAVGHRVVHGGEKYTKPTVINVTVMKELKKLIALAPLHNPHNIAGIAACQKLLPKAKNVAVFDTAFHQTLQPKAYLYALPQKLYTKNGIRRYGFHGSSHAYVSRKAAELLKQAGKTKGATGAKIVTCHMGNGASIAAVKNGKSIDTSMGYTPLEGIPMGTRSGDIDPAIVLELIKLELAKKKGRHSNSNAKALEAVDHLLNKESGLLGVSGTSSDMRNLWAAARSGGRQAKLTISLLAYRTAKYIGGYVAALNGLNAIVFTAGLGQKAWYLRAEVCSYLEHLGVQLSAAANKKNALTISSPKSKVKVFVIPTDEEKEIALQTLSVLKK